MKRHVFVPAAGRFVSVEDGTVRDLNGTVLGYVTKSAGAWEYVTPDGEGSECECPTQAYALSQLLRDPSCPTPGPNRYDR